MFSSRVLHNPKRPSHTYTLSINRRSNYSKEACRHRLNQGTKVNIVSNDAIQGDVLSAKVIRNTNPVILP